MGAKMKKLVFLIPLLLGGCQSGFSFNNLPESIGEQSSAYGYIPIDAVPVETEPGSSCSANDTAVSLSEERLREAGETKFEDLPEAFPDLAVRIAYRTFNVDGSVSLGPFATTQKGGRYQVIIDFINSDVSNYELFISKFARERFSDAEVQLPPFAYLDPNNYDLSTIRYQVLTRREYEAQYGDNTALQPVNIPVYVGVGLRITADITSLEGKTDISGLGPISAAAENGQVSGSLLVQTLGINSEATSGAFPIQGDLNSTSIQNAIVAIGSVKALIYQDETILKPRVVGLLNPLGGGQQVVNSYISAFTSERPVWRRSCILLE